MTSALQNLVSKVYQSVAFHIDATSRIAVNHYITLSTPTVADLVVLQNALQGVISGLTPEQVTISAAVNTVLQVVQAAYIGSTDISGVASGSDHDDLLGVVGTRPLPSEFGLDSGTGQTSISNSLESTYRALGALSFGYAGVSAAVLLGNSTISGDVTSAIAYLQTHLADVSNLNNIVNANISATAAIAYSKLNLASSIVNNDIANNAIYATKLYAEYGNEEDTNLKTYLGTASIKAPALSKSVGGGTLSYKFARDSNIYVVSMSDIQKSLSAVCFNYNTYSTPMELAIALMNAIGNDDPYVQLDDLAFRIGITGTLRDVQQRLYNAIHFASNTAFIIASMIIWVIGSEGSCNVSNFTFDLDNAVLIDSVSLTTAIGPFALTTEANTLTGATNEHDTELAAVKSCAVTLRDLGEAVILADLVTFAGCVVDAID